jgi:hypothetical protein
MTVVKYVDLILTGELQRFYTKVEEEFNQQPIVIEDNATFHTARICQACRQE